MEECAICYYDTSSSDFYDMQCCKNNRICRHCIELLTVPLCPFCRTRIQGLPEKMENQFRGAISLGGGHEDSPILLFVNPMDDMYIDSRILRRQIKRLRKVQERERQAEYNRHFNSIMNESNRQQKKKELTLQIKEEKDIFLFEQDDDEDGEHS